MSPPFLHEALFYGTETELLEGVVPFVRDGLAADEPVLVALPARKLDRVCSALSEGAERVSWVDIEEVGRNPARILPVWHAFAGVSAGSPCRGIGEPLWPGRAEDEREECHRHEHLLNHAFHRCAGFRLLCPYDTSGLDPHDVELARASHPRVVAQGDHGPSSGYLGDRHATLAGDLPEPAGTPLELSIAGPGSLAALRAAVRRQAREAGVPADRVADVVLAVDELASNSLVHGGGEALVRVWRGDGELMCEVRDRGRIRDPLAGRIRPAATSVGGRGLWIVNQVCDLVELRSSSEGTVVRVRVARPSERAALAAVG